MLLNTNRAQKKYASTIIAFEKKINIRKAIQKDKIYA